MSFAVALGLHHLLQHLPAGAAFRIVARQRLAGKVHRLKHAAVGEVAIVRDGKHPAACFLFIFLHPLPQLLRILTLPGGERHHLIRKGFILTKQHVSVQVVAARHRGPLVADHGGETARVVVLFCSLCIGLPHSFHDRTSGRRIGDRFWQGSLGLRRDHFIRGIAGLFSTRLHRLVPALQGFVAHKDRVAVVDLVHHTQPLGMI